MNKYYRQRWTRTPYQGDDGSDSGSSPSKIRKKDFFSSLKRPKSPGGNAEVDNFFQEPIGSLNQLHRYPSIKNVFKWVGQLINDLEL